MKLDIDGITVTHRVNPKLKHAYLQVEANGSVILKSNGKNLSYLERFVASKRPWIERQLNRLSASAHMQPGRDILYMGTLHPVEAFDKELAGTNAQRAYDRFYKTRAQTILTEKTHRFAERMNLSFTAIRFRKMKRRWGSCSKEGVITFNTLLMQLPETMIEYTVVHELAHRIHFNHSADFHALVATYIPDEKELRRKMRHLKIVYY